MKNLPLVQPIVRRLRRDPRRDPDVALSITSRRPFRLWMTGSLAVVMAALAPMRDFTEANRSGGQRVLRLSRYGVDETLLRIEAEAHSTGLSVLARLGGAMPVIVLASSVGGTPVLMRSADSRIDIPLSVQLRESSTGQAEVLMAAAHTASVVWEEELPAGVAADVAALPALLDRALT